MVFTADDYRRVIHATPAFQVVLNGVLLTHAVLFVGYSLSDTNFRLLLDNQLTVLNGRVPPRYAIMEDVGPAESDLLWRTARLRVLPYPRGEHGEVGHCLATLADRTAPPSRAISRGQEWFGRGRAGARCDGRARRSDARRSDARRSDAQHAPPRGHWRSPVVHLDAAPVAQASGSGPVESARSMSPASETCCAPPTAVRRGRRRRWRLFAFSAAC